jgi:two-component system, OmpR family, response regulator
VAYSARHYDDMRTVQAAPELASNRHGRRVMIGRHARVLIIEDHAAILDTFCEVLRRAGFEVEAAATMTAALTLLSTRRYAAIIADLGLPDVQSIDTLAALRGIAPHSPIVVCSAILTDELQHQAALFGAVALLEKPVTLDQLVETVARVA